MDERARRIGRNEAVARSVNEKLDDLNDVFSSFSGLLVIICECGDAACIAPIELSREAYAQLRTDPTHFAVIPGHEVAGIEEVLERYEGYNVVRKYEGLAATIAKATAP